MDMTQFLLSTAVTITTILLIMVSLQLISLLKHLKNSPKNELMVKKPENKKNNITNKKVSLINLLEKIKILTPRHHSPKKKFFKSS